MLKFILFGSVILLFVLIWHKLFNRLFPRYSSHSRLIANSVIGLVTFLLLNIFHQSRWVMEIEDYSMDFAMQVHQKNISSEQTFVLLDIDNKTHQAWDEPLFTPRNHLKNLIEMAVDNKAKLVIVDVDLSQETPVAGLQLPEGYHRHPYDQELFDYLAKYAKVKCAEKSSCPPIILYRAFHPQPELRPQPDSSFLEKVTSFFDRKEEPLYKARPSFLDPAVLQSKSYVYWASSLFISSTYDQILRRWWLWQPICLKGQPEVIPSIQLLAAMFIQNKTIQEAQNQIKKLDKFKKDCPDVYMPPKLPEPIVLGEKLIVTEGLGGVRQRIMYRMPWKPPIDPENEDWWTRYSLLDKEGSPVVRVVSAQPFLDKANDKSLITDSIVVIAGSYSNGRDIHLTPLGKMPGGLVIINAINSLLHGEIQPLPDYLITGLTILVIIIVSFILTKFNPFLGIIMIGTIVIFPLMYVSVIYLNKGIWIDFTLPLLAVQFQHIAADFYQKKNE